MDTKEKASRREDGKEAHKEDHSASRVGVPISWQRIAPTKGKAKERREKEKEDFKEHAITAENSGAQPRSVPSKGAKGKAKARAKPKEKEEYGK